MVKSIHISYRRIVKYISKNYLNIINEKNNSLAFSITIFLLLSIPSLIVWLISYPGFLQADHQSTIAGIAVGNPSQWHSLLWGFFAYIFIYLSPSYGLYGLVQICFFSICTYYAIDFFLKEKIINGKGAMALSLFFGLCPTFFLYNLLYSSDIIFAISLIPLIIFLIKIDQSEGNILTNIIFDLEFISLTLILVELRKNALLIPFLLFFIFIFKYPKVRGRVLFIFISIFLLFGIISFLLSYGLNAQKSPSQELLSVPAQQIARTFRDNGTIPTREWDNLTKIRSADEWKNSYIANTADPEKSGLSLSLTFIHDWIVLGWHNPRIYWYAYRDLMSPYWQLSDGSDPLIQLDFTNSPAFTTTVCKSSCRKEYISQMTAKQSPRQIQISLLRTRVNDWKMPIVTDLYNLVFFNRAFPLIFLLVSLGIAITRKFARSFMLITLPLIAVMASLLLFSPVSSFRYAIQIYYSIPLIIIWMIFRMNQSKRGGRLVY